jgi:hypothetical protein
VSETETVLKIKKSLVFYDPRGVGDRQNRLEQLASA